MTSDPITLLLEGRYHDPDGGPLIGVPTQSVVINETLAGMEAELVEALGFGPKIAVVSDTDTREALGTRIERAIGSIADVTPIVLPQRRTPLSLWARARSTTCANPPRRWTKSPTPCSAPLRR